MISYILTCVCGALAFRSVAVTNEWLKSENFVSRPQFLHRRIPFAHFIMSGFIVVLGSAVLLGWRFSRWSGLVLAPVEIFFGSQLLDYLIVRLLPARLQYSIFLNPTGH